MAFFYLLVGLSIPLLFLARHTGAVWGFAGLFGFAIGADYMIIPLVVAECFGVTALGQLLALFIMGYSVGQWAGPAVLAGRVFDATRSYDGAWAIMIMAGILGVWAVYAILSPARRDPGIPDNVGIRKTGVRG